MRAVEDVIAYKLENGLPVFDAAREDALLGWLARYEDEDKRVHESMS